MNPRTASYKSMNIRQSPRVCKQKNAESEEKKSATGASAQRTTSQPVRLPSSRAAQNHRDSTPLKPDAQFNCWPGRSLPASWPWRTALTIRSGAPATSDPSEDH